MTNKSADPLKPVKCPTCLKAMPRGGRDCSIIGCALSDPEGILYQTASKELGPVTGRVSDDAVRAALADDEDRSPVAASPDFLDTVRAVVSKDGRGRYYGEKRQNHACTADLWSAFLTRRFGVAISLTARDVCLINALQKISRDANRPKADNLIDLAGYAENAFAVSPDAD